METYAQVKNGNLINKKVYGSVPEGEAKLLKAGYKKVVEIRHSYNGKTQRMCGTKIVEKEDIIEIHYIVKDIVEIIPMFDPHTQQKGEAVELELRNRIERRYPIMDIPLEIQYEGKIQSEIVNMQRAAAIENLKIKGKLPDSY